jgi:mediator of RNA polymerase II transcription subunit 12
VDKETFDRLSERNERIRRIKHGHMNVQRSSSRRLIRLLDSAYSSNDLAALSAECLEIQLDRGVLIAKVLEWASTPFRHGSARIYVTVRLLRRWKKSGIDTDSHILEFLTQSCGNPGLRMPNVYHVISELVRSQSFSVGKYLQRLMAGGVIRSPDVSGQNVSLAIVRIVL